MITLDEARELLKKAVDTQGPGFIYNPGGDNVCHYSPREVDTYFSAGHPAVKSGCLIGVALRLAGEDRHNAYRGGVNALAYDFPDMMTEDAAAYFRRAQIIQDNGQTWGAALEHAELWANELTRV